MKNLRKREVRYWLFRFKTEEEGGAKAKDAPKGLKKHFEKLEWFDGFGNFGVTWDVKEDSPLEMRKLERSHEEEWNEVLIDEAKDLPGVEDGSEAND